MRYDKSMDTTNEMPEMKPRIHLSSDEFPEVAKWEVGETYTVLLELKQVMKKEEDGEDTDGCFEIIKLRELPKTKGSFSKDQVAVAMDMKKLDYLR